MTLERRQVTNRKSLQNGKTRMDQVKPKVSVLFLVMEKTAKGRTKPNVVGVDNLVI